MAENVKIDISATGVQSKNDKVPVKKNEPGVPEQKKDNYNLPIGVIATRLEEIITRIKVLEDKLDKSLPVNQSSLNYIRTSLDAISNYMKPWYKR